MVYAGGGDGEREEDGGGDCGLDTGAECADGYGYHAGA